MEARTAVVLADGQPMLREGLKKLLEATERMRVVAEADSNEQAIQLAGARVPRVVLLSLLTAGLENTVQSVLKLKALDAYPGFVVLMSSNQQELAAKVIEAGADGCISTNQTGQDLVHAIDLVATGRKYITSREFRVVRRRFERIGSRPDPRLTRLTGTERRILELTARGLTSREISRRIHLAPKSVDNGRARVKDKLRLKTRAEIVAFALDAGILT